MQFHQIEAYRESESESEQEQQSAQEKGTKSIVVETPSIIFFRQEDFIWIHFEILNTQQSYKSYETHELRVYFWLGKTLLIL